MISPYLSAPPSSLSQMTLPTSSKDQPYAELAPPRAVSGDNLPEGRRADERVRQVEIRAVEEIKRLGTKLEARFAAAEREMLDDPQVHVLAARPVENVSARM